MNFNVKIRGGWTLAFVAIFSVFLATACFGAPTRDSAAGSSSGESPVPADAAYRRADLPVAERVEDLLARMTLKEKIGQMTQIAKEYASEGEVSSLLLGSVLSGGGGTPGNNDPQGWIAMVNGFQDGALSTRLGIPIIYGIDSVHGHNNLKGATVFPHNIGQGATGDADLVARIGEAVAIETLATGIPWNFGPCVAVARDPRWGRTYESYGQDTDLVTKLGTAYIRGYQGFDTGASGVKPAATAKHFLGDGGTVWGSSTTGDYKLDQGDTRGDDAYLREVLLPPYSEAVKNGVRTVMVSFSSWNGVKMHARKDLVTGLLKGELGFTGFVVSDWAGMDQIDADYYKAMVAGINAGVDMNMVPYDARKFIGTVEKAVEAKDIPMERIDDAVRRILRVKFEMGLFERPKADASLVSRVRSPAHLALAREAVAKSQVILRNDGTLPLAKDSKVYVAGRAANDIGMQCGGWTITWQGKTGAITPGTTILAGLKEKFGGKGVVYSPTGEFAGDLRSSVCLVVAGETPYAEGMGDSASLSLSEADRAILDRATGLFDRVVLVIVSGRPLVLGGAETKVSAVVASWLPGTEGGGVADVLVGDVKPTGKLSFDWPVSVDQLPLGRFISGAERPLWPVGYGLNY